VESGATVVVGVNRFTDDSPEPVIPAPDYSGLEADQVAGLKELKSKRDSAAVERALSALTDAAGQLMRDDADRPMIMDRIIDAVRARATVGEIADALKKEWGAYTPRG